MTWWKPSTWKKSPSPASSVPSTGTRVYTSSEAKSLTPSQKASATIVSSTASSSSRTPTADVKTYLRERSSGSSSQASFQVAQEAAKRIASQKLGEQIKIAQQKAVEQKKLIEQQRLALIEKKRIETLKQNIVKEGAQQKIKYLTNQLGQRIKTTTTEIKKIENGKGTNVLVYESFNLVTGEKKSWTYEPSRVGGKRHLSGGLTTSNQTPIQAQTIQRDLIDQGLVPFTKDGQVVSFSSKETKKAYLFTEKGVEAYNREIQKLIELKNKSLTPIKKETGKVRALIQTYSNDILKNEKILSDYAKNNNVERLKELQRKTNLKQYEKIEMNRLKKNIEESYKAFASIITKTVAVSLMSLGVGSFDLGKAIGQSRGAVILTLPPQIIEAVKQDLAKAKGSPLGAIEVATEYAAIGGVFKAIGKAATTSLKVISKIHPKYVKNIKGKWVIRNTPLETFSVLGKERYLAKRVQKPSIVRPFSSVADFLKGRKTGQFKRFTKDPGLILKEQTVVSGAKPLSEQILLAGKEVTAVHADRAQLTSWIRLGKIIRKPIPGQKKWNDYSMFPKKMKIIIEKFDNGKTLSIKEFAEINIWLQRNVAPNITLLERSLYLDPASGLRIARLGVGAEIRATLKDIFKGNFRFSLVGKKPQVLIFEKLRVGKIPKIVKNIEKKLKLGKPLTQKEVNLFQKYYQLKVTGEAKAIGSTIYQGGRELEVTIAPGEFIKRIKRVGFTYIEGTKVTFVTAEIFKPSKAILKQVKLANLGKLTKNQLSNLERILSKKLGRKVKVETPLRTKGILKEIRRRDTNIPVIRVDKFGLRVLKPLRLGIKRARTKVSQRITRTPIRKTGRRTAIKRKITSRKPTPRKIVRKPVRRITPRKPTPRKPIPRKPVPRKPVPRKPIPRTGTPGKPIPKKPAILRTTKKFKQRRLSKAVPSYYVVMKREGKMVKLSPKPFRLNDAKDYLAYRVDHGLSRQAFFVPVGKTKKVYDLPKPIKGYFSNTRNKLRPYKIRHGKKKKLYSGYIEKKRFGLDTPGEKREMMLARMKKVRAVRMKKRR